MTVCVVRQSVRVSDLGLWALRPRKILGEGGSFFTRVAFEEVHSEW